MQPMSLARPRFSGQAFTRYARGLVSLFILLNAPFRWSRSITPFLPLSQSNPSTLGATGQSSPRVSIS
eukprot:9231474-Lingulodinium_polyedra.AAC.1